MDTLLDNYYFDITVGDKRMEILAQMLKSAGAEVLTASTSQAHPHKQAVYLLPPFKCADAEFAAGMRADSLVFCRKVEDDATDIIRQKNITAHSYEDDEILVIQNAFLTAEGTLAHIIERTDCALGELRMLVLGLGRVGAAVAGLLRDNRIDFATAARAPKWRVPAVVAERQALEMAELCEYIGDFDIIINTVPALIIKGEELKKTRKNALIIDLASAPGGVDYAAAKALRIDAALLPGVPGKTAPRSAAKYIMDSVRRKLTKEIL